MDGKPFKFSARIWLSVLILISIGSLLFSQVKVSSNGTLNIAFTSSFFVDVNAADGMAATRAWADAIVQKKSLNLDTGSMVIEDLDQLDKAVKEDKLDVVILLSREYFQIEGKLPLVPFFVAQNRGKVAEECLLLVHSSSQPKTLEELENKSILVSEAARASLGRIWLENVLMGKGYASLDGFFSKVNSARKASQALLPVFFKQADACLINGDGFNTMVELNPQLQRSLRVLAKSPPGATSVICIRAGYKSPWKEIIVDSLRDLHSEPHGQQILTLFKVDQLIPFKPSYLDSARQLVLDHEKLKLQVKG